MAKLIIGAAPEFFPLPVEVQTPNGPATVEFTAKHLLATEWAEMREANAEDINAAVKALFDAARADAEAEYAAAQRRPRSQPRRKPNLSCPKKTRKPPKRPPSWPSSSR